MLLEQLKLCSVSNKISVLLWRFWAEVRRITACLCFLLHHISTSSNQSVNLVLETIYESGSISLKELALTISLMSLLSPFSINWIVAPEKNWIFLPLQKCPLIYYDIFALGIWMYVINSASLCEWWFEQCRLNLTLNK